MDKYVKRRLNANHYARTARENEGNPVITSAQQAKRITREVENEILGKAEADARRRVKRETLVRDRKERKRQEAAEENDGTTQERGP